ncbi:MAG: hypothetical protein VKJ06_00710 [Vampirovibrionales bacterium]|nr:hypothetical protein [Vampirovibrionales bacterium]
MVTFFLFRLKIERSPNPQIFDGQETPSELIQKALKEVHERESHEDNHTWRIGNYRSLDDNAVFFALGKFTKKNVGTFDENNKRFGQQSLEDALYTYVLIDFKQQLCAIAHNSKIAPDVNSIARNLARLLTATRVAKTINIKFVIPAIEDPKKFIEILKNAYSIESFSISFSKPNPWDADQDFHGPMQNLLQETDATEGKTTIKASRGQSLHSSPLERLTHSIASTGNQVSARVKPDGRSKQKTIKLEGGQVSFSTDEIDSDDDRKSLWQKMKDLYEAVRGM